MLNLFKHCTISCDWTLYISHP